MIHVECQSSYVPRLLGGPFHSFPNGVKKYLGATNSLRRNFIIHLNVNKSAYN